MVIIDSSGKVTIMELTVPFDMFESNIIQAEERKRHIRDSLATLKTMVTMQN